MGFLKEIFENINFEKDQQMTKHHEIFPSMQWDKVLLALKAPWKNMHLKMLSAGVVYCKKLPNFTDELSIEANSVNQE